MGSDREGDARRRRVRERTGVGLRAHRYLDVLTRGAWGDGCVVYTSAEGARRTHIRACGWHTRQGTVARGLRYVEWWRVNRWASASVITIFEMALSPDDAHGGRRFACFICGQLDDNCVLRHTNTRTCNPALAVVC